VSALLSVPAIVQATPGPAADIGRYTPPAGLEGRSIPIADFGPSAIGDAKSVAGHFRCREHRVRSDIDLLGDLDSVIDLDRTTYPDSA